MTDYYPLLKRAVEGLDKSTGEGRRSLYERARGALVDQLRGMTPPLSESEITRERLALEEAVRKVEAEAARRLRDPAPSAPPQRQEPSGQNRRPEQRPPSPPPRLPAPGLKGLRDVVAESETLGGAAASASRSAREAYAAVPSQSPDLDRLEPRVEPEGLRGPARQNSSQPSARDLDRGRPPAFSDADASASPEDTPPPRRRPGPMPRRGAGLDREEANPARRGLIAALLSVLVVVGLGAAAYWQRDRISNLFGVVRSMAPQLPREAGQTRPKTPDRVGQDGQAPAGGRPGQQVPAVAQRVVLYEEDPQNQEGNRYVGSALWRTETISPGPGLAPEVAVRVDVEVPERRLAMTMSIRRNTDTSLPATHTVEIMFNLPADFAFGGVANVPGLLVKESEQTRGAPLSGLAVKVTNNFFLIGLSAAEADLQRNILLLKERPWFDIPVVYNNGRRAILAVEKGNPGERAFTDAFATWRQ